MKQNKMLEPEYGEVLRQIVRSGRLANAYLIVGDDARDEHSLTQFFLQCIFCNQENGPCGVCPGCQQVRKNAHPDIHLCAPETKSRIISAEQIRELNRQLSLSPFAGGRKAGVVLHADRLNKASANAFLKTLEEPPGDSVILLITDKPKALLPTIVSRCQKITVSTSSKAVEKPWKTPLMEILKKTGGVADSWQSLQMARAINQLLEEEKERIQKETAAESRMLSDAGLSDRDDKAEDGAAESRFRAERAEILRVIEGWQRDLLFVTLKVDPSRLRNKEYMPVLSQQAGKLTYSQALQQLMAVEEMARRLERQLPATFVLETGFTRKKG